MATWEDGPEYAPLERPEMFRAPAAAVALLPGPAEPNPAEGAPPVPPDAYQPPQAPPLSALVLPDKDTRDPHEPYEVVSAALAPDTSAWSATHYRPPTQPFDTGKTAAAAAAPAATQFDPNRPIAASSWTPPVQQLPTGGPWGTPAPAGTTSYGPQQAVAPLFGAPTPAAPGVTQQGWFAPAGQAAPTRRAAAPLTLGSIVKAMHPVVAVLLAVAAVAALLGPVAQVAPVAYLGAAVAAFLLTKVRTSFVRTIFGLGIAFVVFLGFVTMIFDGTTAGMWWDSLSGVSSLTAVLTLLILGAAMASAVRNGELRG